MVGGDALLTVMGIVDVTSLLEESVITRVTVEVPQKEKTGQALPTVGIHSPRFFDVVVESIQSSNDVTSAAERL